MGIDNLFSCGVSHSLVLSSTGEVFQCGNIGGNSFIVPDLIDDLPPISAVSASNDYSLFIDFYGNAWGMGNSVRGQLGVVDKFLKEPRIILSNIQAISASGGLFSVFLDFEGCVWNCGQCRYGHWDNEFVRVCLKFHTKLLKFHTKPNFFFFIRNRFLRLNSDLRYLLIARKICHPSI